MNPVDGVREVVSPQVERICFVIEASACILEDWGDLRAFFIEPLLRRLHDLRDRGQLRFHVSLVLFGMGLTSPGGVIERCPWTSNVEEVRQWLDTLSMIEGGAGEGHLAEGLSECLHLCLPSGLKGEGLAGPASPGEKQCQCVVIATGCAPYDRKGPPGAGHDLPAGGAARKPSPNTTSRIVAQLDRHGTGLHILVNQRGIFHSEYIQLMHESYQKFKMPACTWMGLFSTQWTVVVETMMAAQAEAVMLRGTAHASSQQPRPAAGASPSGFVPGQQVTTPAAYPATLTPSRARTPPAAGAAATTSGPLPGHMPTTAATGATPHVRPLAATSSGVPPSGLMPAAAAVAVAATMPRAQTPPSMSMAMQATPPGAGSMMRPAADVPLGWQPQPPQLPAAPHSRINPHTHAPSTLLPASPGFQLPQPAAASPLQPTPSSAPQHSVWPGAGIHPGSASAGGSPSTAGRIPPATPAPAWQTQPQQQQQPQPQPQPQPPPQQQQVGTPAAVAPASVQRQPVLLWQGQVYRFRQTLQAEREYLTLSIMCDASQKAITMAATGFPRRLHLKDVCTQKDLPDQSRSLGIVYARGMPSSKHPEEYATITGFAEREHGLILDANGLHRLYLFCSGMRTQPDPAGGPGKVQMTMWRGWVFAKGM